MLSDAFHFYWSCLRRAFMGWFGRVEGWASTFSLLLAVAVLFFTPTEQVGSLVQVAPTWFFVGVFTLIVGFRISLAPYLIYRDERDARLLIECARLPSLGLSLPDPPIINSISLRGNTSETIGGTRQTVISGFELDVVALQCVNKGETTAHGVRARLFSMTKRTNDSSELLRVLSPVLLPWDKQDPEGSLSASLAPGEARRIWIGGVRSGGQIWLFRNIKSLPIEYQRLLGEAGTYRILIQVDGDNIAPQQVELEIVASEGPKPQSGIWRGQAKVVIAAQGAPRVEM